MKIKRILAYRVELPLHETTYKWSGGKSVTTFDSTIVRAHQHNAGAQKKAPKTRRSGVRAAD